MGFGGATMATSATTLTPSLPGISWIYYNVYNNDPNGRLRVMAGFNGLEGIPDFVAPVGTGDGSYTDFRMVVFLSADGSALNVRCGVLVAAVCRAVISALCRELLHVHLWCVCKNIIPTHFNGKNIFVTRG